MLLGCFLTLAPRPVLGGGSPGQTIASVVRHRVVDLPTLNRKVDPTGTLTAEEYWHYLEGLKRLRTGTPFADLSAQQKGALTKLGLDGQNVGLVELMPYRDDPLYAVDESRPPGPIQFDEFGKPRCRDCPLIPIEVTKTPVEIRLTERFISVNSTTKSEKTTYAFRSSIPIYLRKPGGELGTEPVKLRFPLLSVAPARGARSVCAPVTETGDLVVLSGATPGAAVSLTGLYRRGASPGDRIVFHDNVTLEGRAVTPGRRYITTYDIALAATMVPGMSMVRGLDGQPLWNLGDGWAVRNDLQLYRSTPSGFELVPGPPELPTNAVAEDGTPIWVLGAPPRGLVHGRPIATWKEAVGVALDGSFYVAGRSTPNEFSPGPGFHPASAAWAISNDAAWAAALVNHHLAGSYVIRPTPKALGAFGCQRPLMGTDRVGRDGRSFLAWPDPEEPGWGVSPEGRLYFDGAPSTRAADPPMQLFVWAASFGTWPYRGSAASLPGSPEWSIGSALRAAYVSRLKAVLSYFYDWGDIQPSFFPPIPPGGQGLFPTTTMAYFLRPTVRAANVYAQAIAAARRLGIRFSSPLPRFLVHSGNQINPSSVNPNVLVRIPVAGFDGIIMQGAWGGNVTVDLSGAQPSGVFVWNRDEDSANCGEEDHCWNRVTFAGSARLGLQATMQPRHDQEYFRVPAGTRYNACSHDSVFSINGVRFQYPRNGVVGGAYQDGCLQ